MLAFTVALSTLASACRRRASEAGVASNASNSVSNSVESTKTRAIPSSSGVVTTTSSADVVTRASAVGSAWQSGAPVVASGSVAAATLRARSRVPLGDRGPVHLLSGGDPRSLGRRACEAVVPSRPPETPILLKPNLGGFDWFKDPKTHDGDDGVRGRITDPAFVAGVIECLRARGHRAITIAEGWGATPADWRRLIAVSGYEAMAKAESVTLVAMDDDGVFDRAPGEPGKPLAIEGIEGTQVPRLLIPKILAEHFANGLVISLPKIKAHRFGVVSVAVKGMQGFVMLGDASPAYKQKWRMHRELGAWLAKKDRSDRAGYVAALEIFAERIADVLALEAPDVVLAEGAPAMGGDGFQELVPSAENVAVAGVNAIAVDRVAAQLLGLHGNEALAKELGGHASSPLIEVAAKRFGIDLDAIEVVGDGAALLRTPRPVRYKSMAGFRIDAAPKTPEAHAVARDGEITIDGALDEPIWARAPKVRWSTDWAGEERGIPTTARFVWSPEALHVAFELEEAGYFVDRDRPTSVEREGLYREDCVEIFLDADPKTPRSYHEIEVGPFGHFFDLAVDGAKSDVTWSSGLRVGTRQEGSRATIELAITAPEITRALRAGARLPLGLFRMEGRAPRRYLAWSPTRTPKPNFHVPEAFGRLVIE
jgi:uncharacterized protein (DUF362 family)